MRLILVLAFVVLAQFNNFSLGQDRQVESNEIKDSKIVLEGIVPREWLTVRIQGKDFIKDFGAVTSYDPNNIDTVIKVSNGRFYFSTNLNSPKFFMINAVPSIDFVAFGVLDSRYAGFHLLVEPGDSLNLLFAVGNKQSGNYTFGLDVFGKGAEKFWCTQQIVNNIGLFKYPIYSPRFDADYKGDKNLLVDSIMKVSSQVLNVINKTMDIYKDHVTKRAMNIIRAQYIPMFCYDIDEFFYYNKKIGLNYRDKKSLLLYNKYKNLISSSIVLDSSILYPPRGFKELIYKKIFVRYNMEHPENLIENSDKFSNRLYEYMLNNIDYEPVKNWIVCNYLWKCMYRFNESSRELYTAIDSFVGRLPDENNNRLKESLELEYKKFIKSSSGAIAYNFNLPDTNMFYHELKDYKGKLVLIDFMFTGCRGCIQMVPSLKKVEEEYKGRNIKFVSISISGSNNLRANSSHPAFVPGSLYLFTEDKHQYHPVIEHYNIVAYPTIVLIGRNGRIIERFKNIHADDGAHLRRVLNENL